MPVTFPVAVALTAGTSFAPEKAPDTAMVSDVGVVLSFLQLLMVANPANRTSEVIRDFMKK